MRLNCNYDNENNENKKEKQRQRKIEIKFRLILILEAIRTVKIHNLSFQKAALEFNMNYRTLNGCCKKS